MAIHFTVSAEQKERLRLKLEGKQCDVPQCPYEVVVTKMNMVDEDIRLCTLHRDLTPEQVMMLVQEWLSELSRLEVSDGQ